MSRLQSKAQEPRQSRIVVPSCLNISSVLVMDKDVMNVVKLLQIIDQRLTNGSFSCRVTNIGERAL